MVTQAELVNFLAETFGEAPRKLANGEDVGYAVAGGYSSWSVDAAGRIHLWTGDETGEMRVVVHYHEKRVLVDDDQRPSYWPLRAMNDTLAAIGFGRPLRLEDFQDEQGRNPLHWLMLS